MKIIDFNEIKNLKISSKMHLEWIDYVLRNRDRFVLPEKVRIPMEGSDYCNIMSCLLPDEKVFGLKVINRSENRRNAGGLNMDAQIFLYDYNTSDLLAILDGNLITTLRTAAVAVHSIINFVDDYEIVSMVGLGNIGTAIGDILFDVIGNKHITVKLYRYKDHAERFMNRYTDRNNIDFVICDTYDDLMKDSDLIISSVSYAEKDFCDPEIYKPGCTILPVHMRGFMECDLAFDHIIVSDMHRAQGFKYFKEYKKVSLTDDILNGNIPAREKDSDRVLVYNLGLAITDLYYAYKIFGLSSGKYVDDFRPDENFYV